MILQAILSSRLQIKTDEYQRAKDYLLMLQLVSRQLYDWLFANFSQNFTANQFLFRLAVDAICDLSEMVAMLW